MRHELVEFRVGQYLEALQEKLPLHLWRGVKVLGHSLLRKHEHRGVVIAELALFFLRALFVLRFEVSDASLEVLLGDLLVANLMTIFLSGAVAEDPAEPALEAVWA